MSKRNKPRRQRATNSIDRLRSGQGTQYDYNTEQAPAFPWLSPLAQDKFAVQLYATDWAAKKIVQIPVDDMLRDGWTITGVDDATRARLEAANARLDVLETVRDAMRLERLVGGAAIYIGASDGQDDALQPLVIENLQAGSLKFLNAMPRTRMAHVQWDTNPLSPGYGRPERYNVNGHTVHRSRFVIFKGDPLLPVPDYTIMPNGIDRGDGFGYSVLLPVYDDLTRATGSRQGAYQLLQRASVFLATMDLEGLGGTAQGETAIQEMRNIVNQINLYRGAVVHKDPGDGSSPLSVIAAQFGSVPELVMSFLQVLSAASDIPATRFLGQAPGGLNASGEGDLENYYGRLESERNQRVKPRLLELQRAVAISELGKIPDGLDIEFEPLWSLSEAEEADVETKRTDNILKLYEATLMTDAEAVAEVNALGIFSGQLSGDDAGQEPEPLPGAAPPLDQTLAALNGNPA